MKKILKNNNTDKPFITRLAEIWNYRSLTPVFIDLLHLLRFTKDLNLYANDFHWKMSKFQSSKIKYSELHYNLTLNLIWF